MLSDLLAKLFPLFLLLFIGVFLRKRELLHQDGSEALKQLVVHVALPAVLFLSFFRMEIRLELLFVVLAMFFLCILLYGIGRLLASRFSAYGEFAPFLFTGFEFGMMGTVFFAAAFGIEKMAYIAVIAFGHELFIWFVYLGLLKRREEPGGGLRASLSSFLRSPVIIGIFLGLCANLLSLENFFSSSTMGRGIMHSLDYLSALTIPLILIVIGYGIHFQMGGLKSAVRLLLVRMLVVLIPVLLIERLLFHGLLQLDPLYSAALYTFAVLPPPFILPLFINKAPGTKALINNTLVLYSLFSLFAFSLLSLFFTG